MTLTLEDHHFYPGIYERAVSKDVEAADAIVNTVMDHFSDSSMRHSRGRTIFGVIAEKIEVTLPGIRLTAVRLEGHEMADSLAFGFEAGSVTPEPMRQALIRGHAWPDFCMLIFSTYDDEMLRRQEVRDRIRESEARIADTCDAMDLVEDAKDMLGTLWDCANIHHGMISKIDTT